MSKTKADLEREVAELKMKLSQSASVPPKEREAAESRAVQARKSVEGISVESVVKDLTNVSLVTGRALSSLSETLTAKTKQLEEIDLAIQVKTADLETLYGKEAVSSALASLIESYDLKKAELEESMKLIRQQWAIENTEHNREVEERRTQLAKDRAREEDAYNYNRDLKRRSDETSWKNELEDKKRQETLRAAELERTFIERDKALNAREDEYNAAIARIASIQNEIDSAVKKEVAIATNSISREHKHEIELLNRDNAAVVASLKAQISAINSENARLQAQVTDLGIKLNEAYAKNVSLSEKALEAASGRQALNELRDLQSMTSSNNGSKAKA